MSGPSEGRGDGYGRAHPNGVGGTGLVLGVDLGGSYKWGWERVMAPVNTVLPLFFGHNLLMQKTFAFGNRVLT